MITREEEEEKKANAIFMSRKREDIREECMKFMVKT